MQDKQGNYFSSFALPRLSALATVYARCASFVHNLCPAVLTDAAAGAQAASATSGMARPSALGILQAAEQILLMQQACDKLNAEALPRHVSCSSSRGFRACDGQHPCCGVHALSWKVRKGRQS